MSRSLKAWLVDYLLGVTKKHAPYWNSAEKLPGPRMFRIISYVEYQNAENDDCVWAKCADKESKITVCFTSSAVSSFASSSFMGTQGISLRDQVGAIVKVRRIQPQFRRIPTDAGMSQQSKLCLFIEEVEHLGPVEPVLYLTDKDEPVSISKLPRFIEGMNALSAANGHAAKHEGMLTKPIPALTVMMNHVGPTFKVRSPDTGAAVATPHTAADATASTSSIQNPQAGERRLSEMRKRRKSRRSDFNKRPKSGDTGGSNPAIRAKDVLAIPRTPSTRAPAPTNFAQSLLPADSLDSPAHGPPSTSRLCQTTSKTRKSALLSSPVGLHSPPLLSSSSSDQSGQSDGGRLGEEDEDEPPSQTRPTTPSEWALTQTSSSSRHNAGMPSPPGRESPWPSPWASKQQKSKSRSLSPSGAASRGHPTLRKDTPQSGSGSRSPKSSTGSLVLQGPRHVPEPEPAPPPSSNEKILVPNSDTSMSMSQSQETGKMRTCDPSKLSQACEGDTVDEAYHESDGHASLPGSQSRQGVTVGERDFRVARDVDDEQHLTRITGSQGKGKATTHPGHKSERSMADSFAQPSAEAFKITNGSSKGKGKGSAYCSSRATMDTPDAHPLHPPLPDAGSRGNINTETLARSLFDANTYKHNASLSGLVASSSKAVAPTSHSGAEPTFQNERKRQRSPHGRHTAEDLPAKKIRRAQERDGDGATSLTAANEPRTSAPAAHSRISWAPDDQQYPWFTRVDNARALALAQQASALMKQRQADGRLEGDELDSDQEFKCMLVSGRD